MSRKLTTAIETFIAAIWRTIFAPITPTSTIRTALVPVRAVSKPGYARVRTSTALFRD